MKNEFRTGSALLIVLGMLSFMVVSAVAFSIFMRQNRLPSSFLRQRILARQLVKAGLSHAMSDIDAAIGDDPYPNEYRVQSASGTPGQNGGGTGTYLGDTYGWANVSQRNYWRNRVFMGVRGDGYSDGSGGISSGGLGATGENTPSGDGNDHLKNTVSTFPLEGLAYIPPPLVNTVRYWSRRSPAAAWKPLDYDSGRYAFTAVNVSDYLDINRLKANQMRDSSPEHRIALGYLFSGGSGGGVIGGNGGGGGVTPKTFDEKMATLASSTCGRLVSLADYNMAIDQGPLAGCGFTSQFCAFIRNPPGGAEFYTDENQARMQKFITDSWYPEVAENQADEKTETLYLTDSVNGQPFNSVDQSLDRLRRSGNKAFERLADRLDLATLCALYDYVDEDNVPISLAVPTIERAPMLTGIRISPVNFAITLDKTEEEIEGAAAPEQKDKRTTFFVKTIGQDPVIRFSGCGVFPFKRSSGKKFTTQQDKYDVQVMVRMFFSDSQLADTRVSGMPYVQHSGTWTADSAMFASDKAWMTFVGTGEARINAAASTDSETAFNIDIVNMEVPANAVEGAHVYGILQKYKKDEDGNVMPDGDPVYDDTGMTQPLVYRSGAGTSNLKTAGEAGVPLYLNYVCWVRILSSEGTVDLVPATVTDDQPYNGHNSTGSVGTDDLAALCGDRDPILPISSDVVLQMDINKAKQGGGQAVPASQGSLAIYCDDPRFNYAPEDWYAAQSGDVDGNTWLSVAQNRCDYTDRRPNEIFQFVASQGYLQSMGELQFLPYLRSFRAGDSQISGAFYNSGKYNGKPFAERTDSTMLANHQFAWRTHWGFGEFADHELDGEECCPYEWGIEDTHGGVAVNPYADEDLFMAALANTPYDYIVASEKENEAEKSLEDNIGFCFNEQSSEAPLDQTQLKAIAAKIVANFASGKDWEEWEDWDNENFFDQSLANFHDIDRKFLFSYWRPCFANNQQLFLVFVRAEPTVIGGSSTGHTPSQLGARAVALVWRNPNAIPGSQGQSGGGSGGLGANLGDNTTPAGGSSGVHKMRVLFYHQFE